MVCVVDSHQVDRLGVAQVWVQVGWYVVQGVTVTYAVLV